MKSCKECLQQDECAKKLSRLERLALLNIAKWIIVIMLTAFYTIAKADETKCLAEAIYREARGESLVGQLAVAQTIINRKNHPNFPDSICKVVFQKNQFSWTKNFKQYKATIYYYLVAEQVIYEPQHQAHSFLYFNNRGKGKKKIGNHSFY